MITIKKMHKIYNSHEDMHGAEWNYEMPAMSYELIKDDKVYWISTSFNFCVGNILAAFYPDELNKKNLINRICNKLNINFAVKNKVLQNIYSLSIFMHFAGRSGSMKLIDTN